MKKQVSAERNDNLSELPVRNKTELPEVPSVQENTDDPPQAAEIDLLIVGGGPAGMAAAVQASECGIRRILLTERSSRLGGILPQCIHDGFGLEEFGTLMTGPEYADAWRRRIAEAGVTCLLDADVVSLERIEDPQSDADASVSETEGNPAVRSDLHEAGFLAEIVSVNEGRRNYRCRSVILASGCRERSRGQLRIPGSRPAGVYTAGAVQYMMNVQNYLPGKSAVILGSGDIGLIMARRMKWEGINVKMILGEQASGLIRNYVQCVKDWKIPLRFSYTVTSIHGRKRIKGVTIAPLGEDGRPNLEKKQYVPCDLLVIAAGLIPEADLWKGSLESPDEIATQHPGLFICGNIAKQYDTVDEVSMSGRGAGIRAAEYLHVIEENSEAAVKIAASMKKSSALKHIMTEEDLEYLSADADAPHWPLQKDDENHLSESEHENDLSGPEHQNKDTASAGRSENGRIVYCINCPRGCRMNVALVSDGEYRVAGNSCRAGYDYALQEMTMPERMLTTTIAAAGRSDLLIPVRTTGKVLKNDVDRILSACRKWKVELPVSAGEVICRNIDGRNQGINLIACDSIQG